MFVSHCILYSVICLSQAVQLVTAINIGVKILESPAGRRALAATGRHVCESWRSAVPPQWRFWGNEAQMEQYVTGFLRKVKADFPLIVIEAASSRDQIAHSRRKPIDASWAPNPNNYVAKDAGGLYFNSEVSPETLHRVIVFRLSPVLNNPCLHNTFSGLLQWLTQEGIQLQSSNHAS